jgi:hypothetical protein
MRTYKIGIAIALCVMLCGCASWIVRPQQVVLLPEERIFTVPAGQPMKVLLDKKPMEMTFPNEMKLVASETLIRQEQKLNNEMLKNVKANADKKGLLTIIGSIFGIVLFGLGIVFKKIKWTPNIKVDVK